MSELRIATQILQKMRNFCSNLLGMNETRWLQAGQLRHRSREMILYSCSTEEDTPSPPLPHTHTEVAGY